MFRYCSSVAFLAMLAFGCASKNTADNSGDLGTGGGFNVGNTGGASGIGGAGDGGSNSERNMRNLSEAEWEQINSDSCKGWTAEGEMVPANIEFIVDTSGSMKDVSKNTTDGRTKWEITRTALEGALDALPSLTKVGMLLWPNRMTIPNYFGLNSNPPCAYCNWPDGSPNPDGVGECVNVSAMVPIGKMGPSGSDQRTALAQTLDAVDPPQGGTPMSDAYNYAIDNNYSKYPQMPGKRYAVLITDGQPTIQTGCMGTGDDANPVDFGDVAKSIAGAYKPDPNITPVIPSTSTFIIGSPGSEEQSLTGADGRSLLSAAATAGGTPKPGCSDNGDPNKTNFCHFDMSAAVDFATGFSDALKNITGQVLDCKYTINDSQLKGETLDSDKLSIVYEVNGSTADGNLKLVGKASDPSCPEDNGWYLDPNDPNGKTIQLCPQTCDKIQQDAGAVLNIRGGCNPIVSIG